MAIEKNYFVQLLEEAVAEKSEKMHQIATECDPYMELLKQAIEETQDREHESVTPDCSYHKDEGDLLDTYVDALAETQVQYPFRYFDEPGWLESGPERRYPNTGRVPSKTDESEYLKQSQQGIQQEPTERSDSSSYSSQERFESDADARQSTHIPSHSSLGSFDSDADGRLQDYPSESTHMESKPWSSERPESMSPLALEDPSQHLQASRRVPELDGSSDPELSGRPSTKRSKRLLDAAQSSKKRRRLNNGRLPSISSEPEMRGNYMEETSTAAAKVPGGLAKAYGQEIRRRSNPSNRSRKTRAHTTLATSLWPFDNPRYHYQKDTKSARHAEDSLYDLIGEDTHNPPLGENPRNNLSEEYNNNDSLEEDCRNGPLGEESLNDSFVEDNRKHSLLWDYINRPSGRDTLYDDIGEDTSQFHQQESEASHHPEDCVYESKAPTASRLCFRDVFPEDLDWRSETTSSDRFTGLTKKPETALRNQKHRLHMYHPPTSTSLTQISGNSGADRRNRQRHLQDLRADTTVPSLRSNPDNESHSTTSRVSRKASKNKQHRAVQPYARTTGSNVARYKDYSELFGEPKGTILVLDGSSFDTKVARSLKSGDGLDIIVASNSAPDETRDITKASNPASEDTGDFTEATDPAPASDLASDHTEHIDLTSHPASDSTGDFTEASDSAPASDLDTDYTEHIDVTNHPASNDTRDSVEPSNLASDHARDITAPSSSSSDDTLLGDDYQAPNLVPMESDQEQCRQHDQQAVADDWIGNVHEDRALFTDFHEFDSSTGLLYEL